MTLRVRPVLSQANYQAGYRLAPERARMKVRAILVFCLIMRPEITIPIYMASEVTIGSRKFYIVSEPDDHGWRANVLEIVDAAGATNDMGIETTGETHNGADDRALGVLQRPLRQT